MVAPIGPSVCELETGPDSNHLLFKKFKYQPKGVIRNSRELEDEMSSSTSETPSSTAAAAESLEQDGRQSVKSVASTIAGGPDLPSETSLNQPPDLQSAKDKPAYLIRWNRFEEQVCNAFSELFCSDHFVDVTLACEGELLKAHKIVLAMSSPFFRRIFQETPCKHPVVIIKGMTPITLRNILQYIYLGEVVLNKEDINSFMDAADYLSICGVLAQLYSCDISTTSFKESKSARESEQDDADSKLSEAAILTSENEDGELLIDDRASSEKEEGSATEVASVSPVIKYHGVKSRWTRRYSNTSYHGNPTTTSPGIDEREHKRSASAGEVESVSQSHKPTAEIVGSRVPAIEPLVETPSDVEMSTPGDDSESYEEPPVVPQEVESRQRKVIQRAYPKHYGHHTYKEMDTQSEDVKYHSQGQYPPVFNAATVSSTPATRAHHHQSPYPLGSKDFSHPLQVNIEPHSQSMYTASSTSSLHEHQHHASTKAKFHSGFTLYTSQTMPSQRSMHRTQSESDFPPSSSPISLVSSQGREDRSMKHRQVSSGSSTTSPTTYIHPDYHAPRSHISILSAHGLQLPGSHHHRPRHQFMDEVHREHLEGRYRSEERDLTSYGTTKDFMPQSNLRFGSMSGKPHSFPTATDLSVPVSQHFGQHLGYMQQLKSPSSSSGSGAPSTTTRPKTKAIRSSQVPQSSRYTAAEVDMMVDAVANYPGNIVPCTLCQKFVKRERLRAHIHECHLLSGEKIICPHCGIALKSKGSFRVHIWRHKRGALPTRSTMTDFDRDRPPSPTSGPASH